MRILEIVAGLDIGRAFGGAERLGVELARAMRKAGHQVTLCSFWRLNTDLEQEWLSRLREEDVPVLFASAQAPSRGLGQVNRATRRILAYAKDKNFDVAHSHHEGGTLAAIALQRAGLARLATRTAHVPPQKEWGSGRGTGALRAVMTRGWFPLNLLAEAADSEPFAQALNQRAMARRFGRKAVHIPTCFSAEIAAQAANAIPQTTNAAPVIGFVGRLAEQKGVRFLLEAMPQILAQVPFAQLKIVGDGELRGTLETLAASLGVQDHVQFCGAHQEAWRMMREFDVMVMPSVWEGTPLTLLEAMALGTPVAASDIDGVRDAASSEVAWVFAPQNSAALASAVLACLADGAQREQRAALAQQTALDRYSPQTIAGQYVEFFEKALA